MLANNNQQVIARMAKRSLKSNRRRSLIMITAVMLSAFMLFCVFTVGITYFKMNRIQNIRMNGGEFDAIMYGVTPEQQKMCEESEDILYRGISAVAGYVKETNRDSTPNVGLIWSDETFWNQMMKPAREWVEGEYPQDVDEIMVTKAALKECGMEELEVGDSFTMTYEDSSGEYTKEFRISGMWDGFGAKKVFYVSKAFYEQCGRELADVGSGRYYLDFKQNYITLKEQDAFIESLNLGKQQRIFYMAEFGYSLQILGGIAGLVLVTCFCAYLLIYNIMYLSVSGNIRYYGLLQTVGMTGKQIYRLMRRQMLLVGGTGIAAGLLLGGGTAFFLIPNVVKVMGIRTGKTGEIQVSFHPVIFLLTILIIGFTVWLGSRKPAKMAVSISPVAALQYRTTAGKKNVRKTGKGRVVWRMARQQLTKDKKKTGIVILSLGAGLSVFLCLVTLIDSHGPRTIISNYMKMDMVIKNDTMKKESHDEWKQLLDAQFLADIRENEKIKELHPLLSVEVTMPWEPEFMDVWMREFYETWMNVPYEDEAEEYKEHPENFGSFLIGIDDMEFDYLNEAMETPVDKKKFLEGKTCIVYRDGLDLQMKDLQGKTVTCAEYADAENMRTFEIAGFTDENYYTGSLVGIPPTIVVSDRAVKDFVENPFVDKAAVRYEKEYDENAEADMLALIAANPGAKDFSYDSKIESMKDVEKAQGNMMGVGMGIVIILAIIGILNYVNTVTGNIQNRQVELAILESVGMTEKQIKLMLVVEGFFFAGLSLLLTATVGVGITYWLFQSMNYRGIPFTLPVLPVVGMLIFILLVCMAVPLLTQYVLVRRGSVVERIKGFE